MDLLGTRGEEAAEGVENLSQRLEDIESHVTALDNALHDLEIESDKKDSEIVEENRERLKDLEELMVKMSDLQQQNLENIKDDKGATTRLEEKVKAMNQRLKRTRQKQDSLESRMEKFEEKLFEVEEELTSDVELNEARIKSRVEESEFNTEVNSLRDEISRMKTSVNALADELDQDSIRVE